MAGAPGWLRRLAKQRMQRPQCVHAQAPHLLQQRHTAGKARLPRLQVVGVLAARMRKGREVPARLAIDVHREPRVPQEALRVRLHGALHPGKGAGFKQQPAWVCGGTAAGKLSSARTFTQKYSLSRHTASLMVMAWTRANTAAPCAATPQLGPQLWRCRHSPAARCRCSRRDVSASPACHSGWSTPACTWNL